MKDRPRDSLRLAQQQHDRHWRDFAYCYPVVSRRSGGLSIGVNLNPDKACNFDCIYCQVDRAAPPTIRKVDLAVLGAELERLLDMAIDGSLFAEPPFDFLPSPERVVRDIAFSGDGEPTTYPRFEDAVRIAAEARRARRLDDAKLVLITDACYLTKPAVRAALRLLDENNGEVWAKLDAGTQSYYAQVNRPNFPLSHVMENIIDAARMRPIVIQSMWMRVHGQPPPDDELRAFAGRLEEILSAGGRLKLVQVYTIARNAAEPYAEPLTLAELDHVAAVGGGSVRVPLRIYGGSAD